MRTLSELISNYRKENKLSLRTFAEKCGLSHTFISYLEKNSDISEYATKITKETIEKIARGLDISTDVLMLEIGYITSEGEDRDLEELVNDFILKVKSDNLNYKGMVLTNWQKECIIDSVNFGISMINKFLENQK